MPVGLMNVPSVFQRHLNRILSEKIDYGVVVYRDNVLIYTQTEEKHIELVCWVLKKLSDNGPCVNIDKCIFHVPKVEFVGFQIGTQGVQMSQKKVEDILNWPAPRSMKEVQKFIGFTNFYRQFIQGFSKLTLPIQTLTHNGVMWNWTQQCQGAFEELKYRFMTTAILCHYYTERRKQIETDTSDLANARILSPYELDKRGHPLAFYNKRFLAAELNYDVYDKEMVVIMNCFQEWRYFLMDAPEQIVVYMDYKNLEYFNTTQLLNRRQSRCAEILSEFNFKIIYHPGERNGKADALSHRVDPELEGEREKQDLMIHMFKPGPLNLGTGEETLVTRQIMAVKASQTEESKWSKEILEAGLQDNTW